jgi:hypothetical protein
LCEIFNDCNGSHSCFLRGTPIGTPGGYCAVETLAAGDQVLARFAGAAPIEQIRSFTLSATEAPTSASRPVRIRAGALGDNSPAADICLTGSHGVFIEGAIVPVINLVNGSSIVFEPLIGDETLDFFHIALKRHDILDVGGAACESLCDPAAEEPCAPVLSFHGRRDQLRSRLRSMTAIMVDRRQPLDVIRDQLEERGLQLAKAA